MCVIMVKPMGVAPLKKEWLNNAAETNSDGWGLSARSKEGLLTIHKGFTKQEFIELGEMYGEEYEVVAHARISTSGKIDRDNLHPFPIYKEFSVEDQGKQPEAYLFHNGILGLKLWEVGKNDTWHLARVWERWYGEQIHEKMRLRGWRRRQKKWLGDYNKFVLIDSKGYVIINPNAGKWHENVWHSNDTAIKAPVWSYGYGSGTCYGDFSNKSEGFYHKKPDGSYVYVKFSDLDKAETMQEAIDAAEQRKPKIVGLNNDNGSLVTVSNVDNKVTGEVTDNVIREVISEIDEDYDYEDASYDYPPFGGLDEDDVLQQPMGSDAIEKAMNAATSYNEYKRLEALKTDVLEEWIQHPNIEDVEETIFNFDSANVARAIVFLMEKAGFEITKKLKSDRFKVLVKSSM